MFKWLFGLFNSTSEDEDISDDTDFVPVDKEDNTYVFDEMWETEEDFDMPSEILERDIVTTDGMVIKDQHGREMATTPNEVQRLLHRPDNFDGLPGLSVPTKKQRGPAAMPPKQPQHPQYQQPQPPPQYQPQVYQQPPYQQQVYQQPPSPPPYQPQPYYGEYAPQQAPQQFHQQEDVPVQQPPRKPKLYPCFEQYSMDNEYHLEIDLPGIDEQSISIEYVDGFVTISGSRESAIARIRKNRKKKTEVVTQDHQSTIPNHLQGEFAFDFPFKKQVDESSITADYTNGILHITLPHRIKGDKVTIGIGRKKPKQQINTSDLEES